MIFNHNLNTMYTEEEEEEEEERENGQFLCSRFFHHGHLHNV